MDAETNTNIQAPPAPETADVQAPPAPETAVPGAPQTLADALGFDPALPPARRRGRPRKVELQDAPAAQAPDPAPAAAAAPRKRDRRRAAAGQPAGQAAAAGVAAAVAAAMPESGQAQLVAQLLQLDGGALAQFLCALAGWAPLTAAEQQFVSDELASWEPPQWLGRAVMWASILWPRLSTDPRIAAWWSKTIAPKLGFAAPAAAEPAPAPAAAEPAPAPAAADDADGFDDVSRSWAGLL